jgi:eukaryotic-like serine/threonine-protein kinase
VNDPQDPNQSPLGRYQTLSELAKSPIGGLVMALDLPEQRLVALRSLPVETKLSAEDCANLLEAGRWVKGLDDPAIMMPLDVVKHEGLLYAAYHYRVSEPLRAVLRLSSFKGIPMPLGVALRIAHDSVLGARAIEACGASPTLGETLCGGLLPDSVLIGQNGTSRICDAGIGAILRRTREYGQQVELLGYAAPEQLEPSGVADGRSDVFTIGVFLWEMLANRRLFAAHQSSEVIDKVRTLEVPLLDSLQRAGNEAVPEAVALLVKRALEREPADRYAGTTALLQALETHAGALMASPTDVGAYVSALVGNIFETRSRAIERVLPSFDNEDLPTRPATSPRLSGSAPKGQDLRPRAATTKSPKSSPVGLGPIPPPPPPRASRTPSKPKLVPTPLPSAPPDPAPRAPIASSPPVIAALVDDAIAQGAREAQQASSVHPTLPPHATPLQAVIPALPSLFQLPGAELFARPGLPSAKPAPVEPPTDTAVDQPKEEVSTSVQAEDKASEKKASEDKAGEDKAGEDKASENKAGEDKASEDKASEDKASENKAGEDKASEDKASEVATTASPAKSEETEVSAADTSNNGEAPPTPPRRAIHRGIGLALLSLLAMAFVVGLGVRRCTGGAERRVAPRALDGGTADGGTVPSILLDASALDAGQVLDASVPELADAGPAPTSSARVTQSLVPRRKSTAAPRYNAAAPRSTTAAPRYNAAAPRSTTAAPRSTTAAPRSTTAAPRSATTAPRSTTAAPRSATTAPRSATTAPRSTAVAPRNNTQVAPARSKTSR